MPVADHRWELGIGSMEDTGRSDGFFDARTDTAHFRRGLRGQINAYDFGMYFFSSYSFCLVFDLDKAPLVLARFE